MCKRNAEINSSYAPIPAVKVADAYKMYPASQKVITSAKENE
jgi:hypothetical protein